jgi:hypothetical protein
MNWGTTMNENKPQRATKGRGQRATKGRSRVFSLRPLPGLQPSSAVIFEEVTTC